MSTREPRRPDKKDKVVLTGRRGARTAATPVDMDVVTPASRAETLPVGMFAIVAGFVALAISATHGYMLLYGDAVAHLGIARRILDTRYPGLMQLGGVWLPLPHLLMLPFVGNMEWWQNGMAGAWPSLIFYVIGVMGFYRLTRRVLTPLWALVGDGVLWAEREPAVPGDDGDDGAAVPGAAGVDCADDDGVRRCTDGRSGAWWRGRGCWCWDVHEFLRR